MITHLHYEAWLDWVPALAFALIFGVFAFSLLRLWLMKPGEADHQARRPLEDEAPKPDHKHS